MTMRMDGRVWREIRRAGGDELLRQLLEMFVGLGPQRIGAVQAGLEAGDPLALRKALHSLRSSSATLGAQELSALAASLEGLAEEARVDAVAKELPRLESTLDSALRTMESKLVELRT